MSSLRWAEFRRDTAIAFTVWLSVVSLLYGGGQMIAWFTRGRAKLLFGVGAAACAWFAALAIESATRLMVGMFTRFGTDLPPQTFLVISAVQSYVPWIMAVSSTLLIVYLWMRTSEYFLHACTGVATVAAVLVSFVALSLVLPMMKCGFELPEWPAPATQSSGTSEKAPNHSLQRTGCAGR